MRIFQNRPLALSVCVMALLVAFAAKLPSGYRIVLLLGCLGCLVGLVIALLIRRRCGKLLSVLLLCTAVSLVGLFSSFLFFNRLMGRMERLIGVPVTVEGYVCERRETLPDQTRFRVTLREINGERISADVLLECEYLSALQSGDRFRIDGELRRMEQTLDYQEEQLLICDGMAGVLVCSSAEDCSIFAEQEKNLLLTARRAQLFLSARLQAALHEEEGALGAALLLGDRSAISGDTELAFRRSGISHLLALSGLHVSVLIAASELLLRRLSVPKRLRAFLIPLAAVGYLLLSGGALSTARAVLMTCALYLGFLLRESYDAFTSVCMALLLILVGMPYAVCDLSLWMSFVAAGAIVLFLPAVQSVFSESVKLRAWPRWGVRLLQGGTVALAVGLFANAAILPLSAAFFGSTSVFSVLVTLLLSPILTPTLILSALLLVFPAFEPLAMAVRFLLRLMLGAAARISQIPNGTVLLDGDMTVLLLLLLVLALILCAVLSLRRRWMALPILLSFAVLLCGYADVIPRENGVRVAYLREKENEVLLLSQGKDAVAVDFSDGSAAVVRLLQEEMREARCTELRELVLTHYHSKDSYLISELSADIRVHSLRLPSPISAREAAIAERLRQEAELHGIEVSFWEEAPLSIADVELVSTVRNTPETVEVTQHWILRIHEKHLVYLGTGERRGEAAEILQNAVFSADYLILGGHGTAPHTWQTLPQLPKRLELLLYASGELEEEDVRRLTDARLHQGVVRYCFFVH